MHLFSKIKKEKKWDVNMEIHKRRRIKRRKKYENNLTKLKKENVVEEKIC